MPGVSLVQVVHVRDDDSINEAVRAAETADALLLDSGVRTNGVLDIEKLGRFVEAARLADG